MRATLMRDIVRVLRETSRRVLAVPTRRSSVWANSLSWRALGSASFRDFRVAEFENGAYSSRATVGVKYVTGVARMHASMAMTRGVKQACQQQQPKPYNTSPSHQCRDKIIMEAMSFHGFHGVLSEEKSLGQKFVVDVTLSVCHKKSGISDDIADTVDYASAYLLIKHQVEGKSNAKDLIEKVGNDIAITLLKKFTAVTDVTVRVKKPHVAVSGTLGSLGIEVFRKRDDL